MLLLLNIITLNAVKSITSMLRMILLTRFINVACCANVRSFSKISATGRKLGAVVAFVTTPSKPPICK